MSDLDDLFLFVIDTSEYAGNFERELCAHCTGCIGDCGVGEAYADRFRKDHPDMVNVFERIIGSASDDNGNQRPVRIWPTPGYWNDGLGTSWPDADWGKPETVTAYRKSIVEHKANHLDPVNGMPERHPSFQSVAILFSERPTTSQLDFLMNRVLAWKPLNMYDGEIPVIGFRLLQEVRTERVLWSAPNPEHR